MLWWLKQKVRSQRSVWCGRSMLAEAEFLKRFLRRRTADQSVLDLMKDGTSLALQIAGISFDVLLKKNLMKSFLVQNAVCGRQCKSLQRVDHKELSSTWWMQERWTMMFISPLWPRCSKLSSEVVGMQQSSTHGIPEHGKQDHGHACMDMQPTSTNVLCSWFGDGGWLRDRQPSEEANMSLHHEGVPLWEDEPLRVRWTTCTHSLGRQHQGPWFKNQAGGGLPSGNGKGACQVSGLWWVFSWGDLCCRRWISVGQDDQCWGPWRRGLPPLANSWGYHRWWPTSRGEEGWEGRGGRSGECKQSFEEDLWKQGSGLHSPAAQELRTSIISNLASDVGRSSGHRWRDQGSNGLHLQALLSSSQTITSASSCRNQFEEFQQSSGGGLSMDTARKGSSVYPYGGGWGNSLHDREDPEQWKGPRVCEGPGEIVDPGG